MLVLPHDYLPGWRKTWLRVSQSSISLLNIGGQLGLQIAWKGSTGKSAEEQE